MTSTPRHTYTVLINGRRSPIERYRSQITLLDFLREHGFAAAKQIFFAIERVRQQAPECQAEAEGALRK